MIISIKSGPPNPPEFPPLFPLFLETNIRNIITNAITNSIGKMLPSFLGSLGLALYFPIRTLKIASASYMTMMSSLTPVLVAILAIVFLKETLVPIQWIGVFLISISGISTQLLKIEKH